MKENKSTTIFSGSSELRDAIQSIAWKGVINPKTMSPYSSKKITGFVAKIHTEGELAGTVDVQEYISYARTDGVREGYHTGVYISAIQNNNGMLIVPMLYSDVLIMQDPDSKREYVVMTSHVDVINLDSHQSLSIGVQEREEFDPSGEVELEDLELTGAKANMSFTKNQVVTEVVGEKDADPIKQTIDASDSSNPKYKIEIGGSNSDSAEFHLGAGTDVVIDAVSGNDNHLNCEVKGVGSVNISDKKTSITNKDNAVIVEPSAIYLGGDSNTDFAVLGNELADVLLELVGALSQMMTTTMMGPQPPLNMASFIQLKVKIQTYKQMTSGFLTKNVQIKK